LWHTCIGVVAGGVAHLLARCQRDAGIPQVRLGVFQLVGERRNVDGPLAHVLVLLVGLDEAPRRVT